MCSQLTHVLVEELPWLPLSRLHELYLAGGEADQQHRGLVGGRGGVEVVTGGICALVQLLINRLADVGRLERGAEAVLWINGVLFLLTICASSQLRDRVQQTICTVTGQCIVTLRKLLLANELVFVHDYNSSLMCPRTPPPCP